MLATVTNFIPSEDKKVILRALVYISYKYQLPGPIREEYVGRMRLAIEDACMLGVSTEFVENSLHPHMFSNQADIEKQTHVE